MTSSEHLYDVIWEFSPWYPPTVKSFGPNTNIYLFICLFFLLLF